MLNDIISTLSGLGWRVVNTFADVFTFLKETTVTEMLTIGSLPWTEAIVEWLVDLLGFGDTSLLSLIVGSGLTIVIVVTLVKWVIGVIM